MPEEEESIHSQDALARIKQAIDTVFSNSSYKFQSELLAFFQSSYFPMSLCLQSIDLTSEYDLKLQDVGPPAGMFVVML